MSAPAATKGRLRDILERVYAWVDAILTTHYSSYYVTMNHRLSITHLSTMPLVTIKVDPTIIDEAAYGRKMPSDGSIATYEFRLHVHQKYNTASGEDYNRDVHICARRVIDHIKTKDGDTTERNDHGIWCVRDVGGRESDPMIRNVARIIVTGTIDVIREDSP